MDSTFLNSLKSSYSSLINAMNEAIELINVKEKLFNIELEIIGKINTKDDVGAAKLHSERLLILNKIANISQSMNVSIVSSISSLILMLDEAFQDPSLTKEITICQGQMKAIMGFVNKEYIKKDINLEAIKQPLLFFIVKYYSKKDREQFNVILNQLFSLYNIANQEKDESKG